MRVDLGGAVIIGAAERAKLAELRELAAAAPVDMRGLLEGLKNPATKRRHRQQMTRQSVMIPLHYLVTYSVELGHPCGTARHLSMSSGREGRVPRPETLWMVAQELGFVGGIEQCTMWPEELEGHGVAINVVQPVDIIAPAPRGGGVLEVEWRDAGRAAGNPADPDYPEGIDVDLAAGAAVSCATKLSYPAPRCGAWIVRCRSCGMSVAVTAAGRPDDPRSVRLPCKPAMNG